MNKKIYSITYILIFLGILAVLNFISSMLFLKLDFSPQKMYSVSPATKKILSRLEDNIIFRVYFTKNLPNPYGANGRYLRDFLEEYQAYSKSKIKLSFIDPTGNEKLQREAQLAGIMPMRFTSVEKDKMELKEGYMGVSIMYNDKTETIPVIKDTDGLEYEISSKIKKLMNPTKKTIGFLTGHNETNPLEIPEFSGYFGEKFNSKMVDTTKEDIPADIDCLLIVGPKTKLTDYEVYLIDQFVMAGKPVGILLNEYDVAFDNFYVRQTDNGLKDMLNYYGVSVNPGLVLDLQCQRIGIQQKQGYFVINNYVEYPFIPVATKFNTENLIVKNFEKLSLPFVSSFETNISTLTQQNRKFIPLMYSSRESWIMANVYMANPMQKYMPSKNNQMGPFVLGGILEGSFDSLYKGRTPPKREKAKDSKTKVEIQPNSGDISEVKYNRIMLSGTSSIVRKEFLSDPTCVTYFMNILDWLAEDYDLLSIRSKGFIYRPLNKVSDAVRLIFKYSNLLLLPILVIFYGLFRWKTRKILIENRSKEILELKN
ncbi:MAG: Gldg family protein [Elusimicrobia bacterium]|nr:Gldg family protein [Elusimicrobiota bacterium]